MQTITVDILDDKAIRLLYDLELLQLIRVRKEEPSSANIVDWPGKYKGAMTKQSLSEIDSQLDELRNQWE